MENNEKMTYIRPLPRVLPFLIFSRQILHLTKIDRRFKTHPITWPYQIIAFIQSMTIKGFPSLCLRFLSFPFTFLWFLLKVVNINTGLDHHESFSIRKIKLIYV